HFGPVELRLEMVLARNRAAVERDDQVLEALGVEGRDDDPGFRFRIHFPTPCTVLRLRLAGAWRRRPAGIRQCSPRGPGCPAGRTRWPSRCNDDRCRA